MLTPLVYRETQEFFARPDWRLLPTNAVEDATDDPPAATRQLVLD
jgi:hypothetical protein